MFDHELLVPRKHRSRERLWPFFVSVLCSVATVAVTAEVVKPAPPAPSEHSAIVDQAIAFHGGEAYRASRTSFVLRSKSGEFRVVAEVRGDAYRYQVEGAGPKGVKRRVIATNDRVELTEDGSPKPVTAEAEQGLRDWVMARVYFPFLPYRLNDPGVTKRDLGLERWGDRDLRTVEVRFAPGSSTDAQDVYRYWFEPTSGQLVQLAYSFATGGGGVRFRRLIQERRVGGILFADHENYGVDGAGLSVDLVTPSYVAGTLKKLSVVELTELRVEPLP